MLTVRQAKREFKKKTQRTVRDAVRDDNGVIVQRRKRERVDYQWSFREFCRIKYPATFSGAYSKKLEDIVNTKQQ